MDQTIFSALINLTPLFPDTSGDLRVLPLGAHIFSDSQEVVKVEIPLNQYFTRNGDSRHGYRNAWAKVITALIEARSEGGFAIDMDRPSDLVESLRRWFQSNNEFYETIEGNKAQVVLVIRSGVERLLVPSLGLGGCTRYVPTSRWVVDVRPNTIPLANTRLFTWGGPKGLPCLWGDTLQPDGIVHIVERVVMAEDQLIPRPVTF